MRRLPGLFQVALAGAMKVEGMPTFTTRVYHLVYHQGPRAAKN